jgi:hypothetical protein
MAPHAQRVPRAPSSRRWVTLPAVVALQALTQTSKPQPFAQAALEHRHHRKTALASMPVHVTLGMRTVDVLRALLASSRAQRARGCAPIVHKENTPQLLPRQNAPAALQEQPRQLLALMLQRTARARQVLNATHQALLALAAARSAARANTRQRLEIRLASAAKSASTSTLSAQHQAINASPVEHNLGLPQERDLLRPSDPSHPTIACALQDTKANSRAASARLECTSRLFRPANAKSVPVRAARLRRARRSATIFALPESS